MGGRHGSIMLFAFEEASATRDHRSPPEPWKLREAGPDRCVDAADHLCSRSGRPEAVDPQVDRTPQPGPSMGVCSDSGVRSTCTPTRACRTGPSLRRSSSARRPRPASAPWRSPTTMRRRAGGRPPRRRVASASHSSRGWSSRPRCSSPACTCSPTSSIRRTRPCRSRRLASAPPGSPGQRRSCAASHATTTSPGTTCSPRRRRMPRSADRTSPTPSSRAVTRRTAPTPSPASCTGAVATRSRTTHPTRARACDSCVRPGECRCWRIRVREEPRR